MTRVTLWRENRLRRAGRQLFRAFRNLLFLASILLIISGGTVLILAESTHYQYNYHLDQTNRVGLRPGQVANITFVTEQNYPTNITFSYLGNQSTLHYSIYEVYTTHPYILMYVYHSLLISSGTVNSNETISLSPNHNISYFSTDNNFYQKHYILLSSGSGQPPTSIAVDFEITIPEYSDSNPLLGDFSAALFAAGLAVMAVFITKLTKKRESGQWN